MKIVTLLLAAALTARTTSALAAEPDAKAAATCRPLPAGKRVVRLSLKPGTDVADLIAWISSVTCKQFVLPAGLGAGKTVTIVSPQLITPEEAYSLFLDALDSVGLTVYRSGRFYRVISVDQAKSHPVPVVPPQP
jgi:hypothetical protein